jgi:Uma2 family endonuclease
MSALPKPAMTTDEFLVWASAQPKEAGRFELIDGIVVTLQSERLVHARVKGDLYRALQVAIRKAGAPCEAVVDGPIVRLSTKKSYRPDGLIYCGPPLPDDTVEVTAPIIVCEVLSPDSIERDHGEKLEGYFSLPSLHHYLIVDPDRRTVIHHRRGAGEDIITRICKQGEITLDPPGIGVRVADLFERDTAS